MPMQALGGVQVQMQQEVPSVRTGRISVVPIPEVEHFVPSIYQDVMAANLKCEYPMPGSA